MTGDILGVLLYINLVIYSNNANIIVLNQGVFPLTKDSVAIQFYLDVHNKFKEKSCRVATWCNKCCFGNNDKGSFNKCNLDAFGGDMGIIEPNERRRIILVYPSIYKHDKNGFCEVVLLYNCEEKRSRRKTIKILYNTNIFNKRKKRTNINMLKAYLLNQKVKYCKSKDENPINNCLPVNCDWKYDGLRPFFDSTLHKCLEIPVCVGRIIDGFPTSVYVPKINKCKVFGDPITLQDVYAIKNGLGVEAVKFENEEKDKVTHSINNLTISQNLRILRDILYGKYAVGGIDYCNDNRQRSIAAIDSIIATVVIVTASILLFVCVIYICVDFAKYDADQCWRGVRNTFNISTSKAPTKEVKNELIRDIYIRDIPLEIRDSALDVCDRMSQEIRGKRRYRFEDLGSRISLEDFNTSASSISSGKSHDIDHVS